MKKFLIIASVICAATCFAQNDNVPPVSADTWFGLIYKVPGMFESEQFEDIHYILTSDTTIGEHTYRKLIQNDTICVGGLRQTEDGMKVYYYDMVSPSNYPFSHVDCLLYDFTFTQTQCMEWTLEEVLFLKKTRLMAEYI